MTRRVYYTHCVAEVTSFLIIFFNVVLKMDRPILVCDHDRPDHHTKPNLTIRGRFLTMPAGAAPAILYRSLRTKSIAVGDWTDQNAFWSGIKK